MEKDKLKEIARAYGFGRNVPTGDDNGRWEFRPEKRAMAALREAYALGLEEAAQVAESLFANHFDHSHKKSAGMAIAERIRQLATRKEQG